MTQDTFDLHETLLRKQEMLVASLDGLRRAIKHGGGKGDVSGLEWRKVTREFLPRRYTVSGKTEVIDRHGHVSQQRTLSSTTRHFCPLCFEEGEVTKVPVKSQPCARTGMANSGRPRLLRA